VLIDSPIEIGRLPARFVPAEQQDEILMLVRLDRALLGLFAVRGRNITAAPEAYHRARITSKKIHDHTYGAAD
jgi:hypothetical protein